MRAGLPTLQELPSVKAALLWLLPSIRKANERSVLMHARLCGLVQSSAGGHWNANGAMATRMAIAAMRHLPDDPKQLGDVLHGLGEIAARSDAQFDDLLIRCLSRRGSRLRLDHVLNVAFARDAKIHHPIQIDTISLAQWLSRAELDWNTFSQAVAHVERGDGMGGGGRYGLKFTAQIALTINAHIMDGWIKSHADQQGLAAIARAVMAMTLPFDGKARITPLLKSRNAAIRCIAAAGVLCPVLGREPLPSLRDCLHTLVAGGIDVSDAIWMSAIRIKRAIHQRYGLEHRIKETGPRLRYVEQNPDAAVGGSNNADAEVRMLRAQIAECSRRQAGLLPELENMLTELANNWPSDGLSDAQMASLENIFVDTAEIRHRLAERLSHQRNRDLLLKKNITRIQQFIGLAKDPTDIPTDYFQPHEPHFTAVAAWAAQSLVLLYANDHRGVGKRTSDIVYGVSKAVHALIDQPFIAARKPQTWQAVMARATSADRFVLTVVASVPNERSDTVVELNKLAIDFAFTLLCAKNIPADSSQLFFQLTAQAVQHMQRLPMPDATREKWAFAEELPDFARALALWSSPTLVSKHTPLASRLFEQTGILPLSQGGPDVHISQMLSLLDAATASCTAAGDTNLLDLLHRLWRGAYREWNVIDTRWADFANFLRKAVTADGPERAQLVGEPSFAQSHCRRLIDPQPPPSP